MNKEELQHLKMAWLAAKEAGDTQEQLNILKGHPEQQSELIDFIVAYHASGGANANEQEEQDEVLALLTQRALQVAMQRVFAPQLQARTITELRKMRNLHKVEVARGLRLSMNVWDKLERGAIQLGSLSQRQLERLAQFFQLSVEQFTSLLSNSRPVAPIYRRQTRQGARHMQQASIIESFADAVMGSDMPEEDKRFWLEE
jgi:transcriptional regulator with XRE-family HTH domain